MEMQRSIKDKVIINGINVYNGNPNKATFYPAPENSGIRFRHKNKLIPAELALAKNKRKSIWLENMYEKVGLVEHLLSAVYALGIDNLEIELSDGICPTTDNCAREYFDALRGMRETQSSPKTFWKYIKENGNKLEDTRKGKKDSLELKSAKGFTIDYTSYYPHEAIGRQNYRFSFDESVYSRDVADARATGFLKNIILGRAFLLAGRAGLHGVNEDNYLLITSKRAKDYMNNNGRGVRYNGDEFVRHKVLDVMGTLALTGRQFKDTEFIFNMTGHKFDINTLRIFFASNFFENYIPKNP